MNNQFIIDSLKAIEDHTQAERNKLKQLVYDSHQFNVGDRLQRVRYENNEILDIIEAEIVGFGVFSYGDSLNIQYWTRVLTPNYKSKQGCPYFDIEMDKAEDFWQGDERWKLISSI